MWAKDPPLAKPALCSSDRSPATLASRYTLWFCVDLTTSIRYVKGVGPPRARTLESKGIRTVEDLLFYLPFRYEDRSNVKTISQLVPGETATVIAEIDSCQMPRLARRDLGLFQATLSDGSGQVLIAKWFHSPFLAKVLEPGQLVALYGKVEWDYYERALVMLHPEYEVFGEEDELAESLHVGRIVPIYQAIGKLTTRVLRTLVYHALESLDHLEDPLPEYLRRKLELPELNQALREAHFPPQGQDLRLLNAFRSPAQVRLIFEEFFWLQCGLVLRRRKARLKRGIQFQLTDRIREQIKKMLPFKPTTAQKRVLGEIARDMASEHPMNRLLQGDVGSGKTLVAAEAAVIAMENGYQVAVLAPTEILASQHFYYFRRLLEPLGYRIGLLIGSLRPKEKSWVKERLKYGDLQLVVGTHALIEEDVQFHKLGLVIIDEQHRFGVIQRQKLMQKATAPDVLVMTATPIPRTLALTIYGDLDVSIIDELPPGRKPVKTYHVTEDQIERVYSFVRREVEKGHQAYIVCPVIEESEDSSLKAAEQTYEHLSQRVFPDLRVGLLHGRMGAEEREMVMDQFKRGEIQILVCTTVIEVGVDVPNATVMVIEHAERFGLAQLHQLRGRVGRGSAQSYCILVTSRLGDAARERIRTMVETTDGFRIAEVDLRLRGPGEFFGTRQSGLPVFRVGNLIRDQELLELARREAEAFVNHPPSREELKRAIHYIQRHWQRRYGLIEVA